MRNAQSDALMSGDIQQLQERVRELAHVNKLYETLSLINQAIVVTTDREELFKRCCHVLVDQCGFRMAWVGWADPQNGQVLPVASCGDADGYLNNIKVYVDDRPEGRGPSGIAFRTGEPCISGDLLSDPATQAWRTEILKRGYRASGAFPLRLEGLVVGTLSVYSDEPQFFHKQEAALLEQVARDISFGLDNIAREAARRQAELTVRQERDFSEAILNGLPGVLYLYDEAGRFLRWNKNFERVTGYSAAEIATMHPLDFFGENEKSLLADRIGNVFLHGESSVEAGFVSRDGQVTPYRFTGVLTIFEARRCLVGVGIDLSAQTREEHARQASDARYRSLFEYAPDGIVIADLHGTYLDVNASMCRMLGRSRQELVGMNVLQGVAPDERARMTAALATIRSVSDYHSEWQFRRNDGSVLPAEVMATRMPDGNIMAMVRDISERKKAEQVLRDAHNSLEHKVVERTLELQAALVRAEAADQVKSAFLATMSHELRTPLNSIIGFTGIVLQGLAGPVNPEQSTQLGMVRSSARHLLELINDVLDISKIEAGQLEVRAEAFDLGESIRQVTASIRPLADARGLALAATAPPQLGEVWLDRRRVEQILLNLLNNAIKFTEHGGVTLIAEIVEDFKPPLAGEPRPGVRLTVTDTGIGIKPEYLVTLFQPFRQIDSGLARQHDGTGLGLAICRRLATLMGGTVNVESQWGKGSTFTVMLPLRQPA